MTLPIEHANRPLSITDELLNILSHRHDCVRCGKVIKERCFCQWALEARVCFDCDAEVNR